MNHSDAARFVRDRLPKDGLFSGHEWRISPRPFPLSQALTDELETLGRVLLQFNRALNRLYQHSLQGKQPSWVADWLDRGKPADLLAWQRHDAFKNELPRIIRPDLLLTENGLSVTELDSVPGGIGLTAWLNQTYAQLDEKNSSLIGGERGMLEGFHAVFGDAPQVHLVISEESSTYRPEMKWLADQLNPLGKPFTIQDASFDQPRDGDAVYRFFELYDLANANGHKILFEKAQQKRIQLTPPPKPIFEEKMMFALLWNRNLRPFWRQELGEGFLNRLQKIVPYTWLLDPTPLPPQGAYPELNLTDWTQLKTLSKKDRELILKISGYSETAWGARGVSLGSDLSTADWSVVVDAALAAAQTHPHVLQRYHKPRSVHSEWFDFRTEQIVPMLGRVRLCPYYFVLGEGESAHTRLGGVLATICPADKKIIHGMKDAILAPCSVF